jgi:hypothetical protein
MTEALTIRPLVIPDGDALVDFHVSLGPTTLYAWAGGRVEQAECGAGAGCRAFGGLVTKPAGVRITAVGLRGRRRSNNQRAQRRSKVASFWNSVGR